MTDEGALSADSPSPAHDAPPGEGGGRRPSMLPGWDESEAAALLSGLARHFDPAVIARPHQAGWLPRVRDLLVRADRADPLALVDALFALGDPRDGFLTAYYEPVIAASRTCTERFAFPLHRRPDDLVRVVPGRDDLPGDGTFARRLPDGSLTAYPDRAAIYAGALDGLGLELAYLADPVDAFFAQVQGSARLEFADGSTARIGYHGKTGHPYTAIGRVLVERAMIAKGEATMQGIRALLRRRPDLVRPVLEANRSYVFFRERDDPGPDLGPVAAGGVPLQALRSLAVDRAHIAHGTPVHVETVLPEIGPFRQVMIAEDAGSAILGPGRGDIFVGSGDAAGAIAGKMAAPGKLTPILPREAG